MSQTCHVFGQTAHKHYYQGTVTAEATATATAIETGTASATELLLLPLLLLPLWVVKLLFAHALSSVSYTGFELDGLD